MFEVQRGDPLREEILVDLIQRAQTQSDPAAYDGLFLLYADRIFRYLLARLNDVDLAEDISSQVFIHLIEKIGLYRIGPKDNVAIFSSWFYRMAYNKMVDVLRHQQRSVQVPIEQAPVAVDAQFHTRTEIRLEFERVLTAMEQLNEQQREVIVLRFIEELSIAETAEVMQKTPGAVKALQHRAIDSLRHHLET
ncbi:MAG: sigma-70 family RNA polymerase sigma factor [Caldilineaceae bacterium]|nr:sigma-70 family RNA polymerase sigma factor [Caldilineaceae bacterium]